MPIDQLFELGIQNDKNIEGKLSITFDDGYVNIFANILDELIKLNIPVTMFLIGNMFNNKIFWRNKIIYLLNNETSLIKFIEQYNKKNNFKINKNFFYQQSKSEKVNSIKLDRSLDKFFIVRSSLGCSSLLKLLTFKPCIISSLNLFFLIAFCALV